MSSASDSRTNWLRVAVTIAIVATVAFLVVDVMVSDLGQLQGGATIAPALDEPALMLPEVGIIAALTLVLGWAGNRYGPREL